MINNDNKTSLLIPSQLPGFIRDEPSYSNFTLFLQSYYEWMEQANIANSEITTANSYNQGVTFAAKNLLNYKDIDETIDDFIDYFLNDFLPYFPKDALVDKRKAIKIARQLYETKGTPSSYQLLFRMLYNSDFDYYFKKDFVLRPSSGTWYVARSLRLASTDPNWRELNLNNGAYRVFGETSKSTATVENSILSGNKTEVFISNIERLFVSGEYVRVVDGNNQTITFNGQPLRAKLVGQISQINIAKDSYGNAIRGLYYSVGDPVIVYGGLNQDITNPVGATATVGSITSGSVQRANVVFGGFGYSSNTIIPNPDGTTPAVTRDATELVFTNLNSGAALPIAIIGSVDNSQANTANAVFVVTDSISLANNTPIGNAAYSFFANNTSANSNTSLANSFSFVAFPTYPISSVLVENGGGGITQVPTIIAESLYPTTSLSLNGDLGSLGILAPIQIVSGGVGYLANDKITITGGSGIGAFANVISVNANGSITTVSYVPYYGSGNTYAHWPLGGSGYTTTNLPTLNVSSANVSAHGASLYVPGVLGAGATFSPYVDRAGSVTTINITNYGEDYVTTPNVSLRVQDIVVSNVGTTYYPDAGDILYQGNTGLNTATYYAYYYSVTPLQTNADPTQSLWNLRVFEYNTSPNTQLLLKCVDSTIFYPGAGIDPNDPDYTINYSIANTSYPMNYFYDGSPEYKNGVKVYGDGNAAANATFLNGLTISQGQYIDNRGQPSSSDVLQSVDYNNYTYEITVEKEIAKYREALLNLLHPTGMKIIGRYKLKSNNNLNSTGVDTLHHENTLYHYTANAYSNVTMYTDFTKYSTNIVHFNNLGPGVNLANAIFSSFDFANSSISLTPKNGENVYGEIKSVDYANNIVYLKNNVWLTFANSAYASTNANSMVINISQITNSYYFVNNSIFQSNTPLSYMLYSGDTIQVSGNVYTVNVVDGANNIIYTTSNVTTTNANTLMSINRTFVAGGNINQQGQILLIKPKSL